MVKRSRSIDQLNNIDGAEFVPDGAHPEMAQEQPSVFRDVSVELIDQQQARTQFPACSPSCESHGESKKLKGNETQQTQVNESPVVSVP
jgi:hypothetical protein